MGEVYRARDPRLRRDVAIKILPAESVLDSERRKRFEQEAQAASALNHPNILVVHDFGADDNIHYLVSELVEGESLRKLVQSGPIPTKRLLEIAVQIADGLAAAHQGGIVHRDLKPENIMVTPENRVKILDFGLAKLAPTGSEESETVSQIISQSSVIRGTIPYMSPEQAAGKTVDFRSDQFSFGLILYEMATGKRAFQKDSGVQILSAIISEEPPPISTLNPSVPAPLRWMIDRCMNKEPRQRYDSTADLYRDLRNLKDHLSETTMTTEGILAAPVRKPLWKKLAVPLIVFVGIVAGVSIANLVKKPPDDLASYRITRLVSGTGFGMGMPCAWSPDGTAIAYSAEVDGISQVFTRDLKSLVSTQLTSSKVNCSRTLWSADGTRVYYGVGQTPGSLWAVSAAGGPSQKIRENIAPGLALSHKTNTLTFFRREAGRMTLWIASPPEAEPKKVSNLPPNTKDLVHRSLHFSPDGSKISLWIKTDKGTGFWILPYPSGEPRQVTLPSEIVEGSLYSWMPDTKHIVFAGPFMAQNSHLRMIAINNGTVRTLTAGYGTGEQSPSVSPDGFKMTFATLEYKGDLVEIPLDGSVTRSLGIVGPNQSSPSWSRSGTQYAYAGENSGIVGVWLTSVSDHWTRPIVTTRELNATVFDSPSISPDGQRVAFQANGNEIWVSPVSGGKAVRLLSAEHPADVPSWSPDGNWISFYHQSRKALAKVEATGTATPVIVKEDVEYQPTRWSPNGDWISCVTADGLSVVSPDGKSMRLLARGDWKNNAWWPDSRTIYGFKFEDESVGVYSVDLNTRVEKRLNELARGNVQYWGFSLSPDGSSVITGEVRFYSTLWLLENFSQPAGFFARLFHR
ncbi:protein kinase [bacterium]|nr:protein kinase [bacterium]